MKYRVVLKVSYNEAWFDFDSAEEACKLAKIMLESMVDSSDAKRRNTISIRVINEDELKAEEQAKEMAKEVTEDED